jgi:hypothetical protein
LTATAPVVYDAGTVNKKPPTEPKLRVSDETHSRLAEIKEEIDGCLPSGVRYTFDAIINELVARHGEDLIERVRERYADTEAVG